MDKPIIITIGRQFGSGGREIGKAVSEKLGISFYDNDLITMAAENCGMNRELLKSLDEKPTSFLYSLSIATSPFGGRVSPIYEMPINDKLFLEQSEIIRKIAEEKKSCIFVGRCSDYVLRENKNVLNVFIHADIEKRVDRKLPLNEGVSRDKMRDIIIKTDKRRASYYNYYSAKKWNSTESYDLSIDSGVFGIEGARDIICYAATHMKEK